MMKRYPADCLADLDKCAYQLDELMAKWGCTADTVRDRLQAVYRDYGIKITILRSAEWTITSRKNHPRETVSKEDLGNTSIICPECQRDGRIGRSGETVYLTQEQGEDDELFCQACGYWPEAKKVDELQIRLARMFHHSPTFTGNNKNMLPQHVAVSSKGA